MKKISLYFPLVVILFVAIGISSCEKEDDEPAATEICDNGIDDDGDGFIDEADQDCFATETGDECSNGQDDDGDGLLDCDDPDCDGNPNC